jgi:glycosyltransferase involved in cell wall biosynthesis
MKISVVIITKNEERNIERCLNSVGPVADEIIVVDSESTDSTREICERHRVRFFSRPWPGFGAQKNFGNEQAQFDLILSIDADEALSPELVDSIVRIKQGECKADAFRFNRLTNYCGRHWMRHAGWYPDDKVRIWRTGCARWDAAEVHESLIMSPESKVEHLSGDLLHYTYQSIGEHLRRADSYSSLWAHDAFARGKRTNAATIWFKSGFTFLRDYFFRLGILDGWYGYTVCRLSALVTFMKYFKLRELQQK